MSHDPRTLDEGTRERLARKGRRLFEKACGVAGTGCVEGFVRHHLRRGEPEVVRDLLSFLDRECERLQVQDPGRDLTIARGLSGRIREWLDADASAASR